LTAAWLRHLLNPSLGSQGRQQARLLSSTATAPKGGGKGKVRVSIMQ